MVVNKKQNQVHLRRYNNTINFLNKQKINQKNRILDLGIENPFSEIMEKRGFTVFNTGKTDLDLNPEIVKNFDVDVVTAFEILEHLVSPFPLLKKFAWQKTYCNCTLKTLVQQCIQKSK